MLQKSESLIRHKLIDEKLQGIISYNHQEKKVQHMALTVYYYIRCGGTLFSSVFFS